MSAFNWEDSSLNHVVTTSSTSVSVRTNALTGLNQSIRVHNIGTNVVYIKPGTSGVTASVSTSMSLAANSIEVFDLKAGQTHLAAIASAAGNTLNITIGQGI